MCIFCGSFCEFSDAASASAGASDKYRFSRSDFGPVPFRPLHYDLSVLFNKSTSDGVNVVSRQTYRNETKEPLTELTLNAHDLKVDSVQVILGHAPLGPPPVGFDAVVPDFVGHVAELETLSASPTKFDYQKDERKLIVTLDTPVPAGEEVVIRTDSTCYPNDTELEGIYFDQTPPGKPQTMISQCQQYGFQRIVPCVDTMNAKTFFTTRITCLAEYENVLCNGDKVEEKDAGDGMQEVTYVNHVVNMAPYLFFIGVGTYDTHVGEVEYPNGDVFLVELLCLPGVVEKEGDARAAVNSLVESIVWTQVCTGPEKYEHAKERNEIMQLVKKRDILKKEGKTGPEIEGVRSRLKELISVWGETGYTYPFKTYREIAMQNSNYGGMENLNNTTILSSMLTPSRWLVDEGYVYMEGVKVHEFYHNINGSQATGETPFEIWLNEAVTVHVQREREDAIFGHDYMRLGQVMYAQQPGSGPLALDRAPSSMAVEPLGFNTTHELISAMTYSKAPEFVRMTQSIIGKDNFVKALFDYHKKFAFSNATSWQWVEEMAVYQPEGVDIVKMAKGWLQRTGYPTLVVEEETWEGGEGKIKVRQTGFEDKKVEKER
jgi:aminopeptidase N